MKNFTLIVKRQIWLEAQCDALQARCDAAELDAARYQWLKENCALGIRKNGVHELVVSFIALQPDYMDELNAAIDSAMKIMKATK